MEFMINDQKLNKTNIKYNIKINCQRRVSSSKSKMTFNLRCSGQLQLSSCLVFRSKLNVETARTTERRGSIFQGTSLNVVLLPGQSSEHPHGSRQGVSAWEEAVEPSGFIDAFSIPVGEARRTKCSTQTGLDVSAAIAKALIPLAGHIHFLANCIIPCCLYSRSEVFFTWA